MTVVTVTDAGIVFRVDVQAKQYEDGWHSFGELLSHELRYPQEFADETSQEPSPENVAAFIRQHEGIICERAVEEFVEPDESDWSDATDWSDIDY